MAILMIVSFEKNYPSYFYDPQPIFGVYLFIFFQTDATMTELEIDMNMRIGEWSIIQESGKELVPCYGPGYTGLVNLGNSCYLNSVMQVMFSLPEFKNRCVHLSLSLSFSHVSSLLFSLSINSSTSFSHI